jgi:ferredoxin
VAIPTTRFVLRRADGTVRATLLTTRDETLLQALLRVGQPITTRCLGSLLCGRCAVDVGEGQGDLPAPNPSEVALLARFSPDRPRARLACQLVLPPGRDVLEVSTPYW